MKHLTKIVLQGGILACAVALAGCSSGYYSNTAESSTATESEATRATSANAMDSSTARRNSELAQALAQQLAPKLRDAMQTGTAKLGVTNLVAVSGQYNDASLLSHVFSENLTHALAAEHLNVLDYKTTNYIRVTEQGDFALSRDYLELDEISPLTHVMVGTLSQQRDGFLVNARIVEVRGNNIVSSGQVFIPAYIADELSSQDDGPLLRAARAAQTTP